MASNGNPPDGPSERTPAIFEQVLDRELEHMGRGKARRPYTGADCTDDSHDCDSPYAARVVADAHWARLTGLAFSGGGIRSATFNLGVLQGLAKLELLEEFDYLSTVSGGGYIGSWLAAWIHAENKALRECGEPRTEAAEASPDEGQATPPVTGVGKVSSQLAAAAGLGQAKQARGAMQPDPAPIRHLREYSNYLTPRRGLWSTDAWTLGAAYIRNLVLTLGVLLGAVVAVVLFAQAFAAGFYTLASTLPAGGASAPGAFVTWPYVPFLVLVAGASMLLGIELAPRRERTAQGAGVAHAAVILTLASCLAGALWLWSLRDPDLVLRTIVWAGLGVVVVTMVFGFGGRWIGNHGLLGGATPSDVARTRRATPALVVSSLLSLLVLVSLWWGVAVWLAGAPGGLADWNLIVWGVPLLLLTYSIAAAVAVGLAGPGFREVEREWLGRFFGLLAKWTVVYTVLMALVVYSYDLVERLPLLVTDDPGATLADAVKLALAGVWAAVSGIGAALARGAPSTPTRWGGPVRRGLLAVAPAVFILGLLVVTIWATTHVGHTLADALLLGQVAAPEGFAPFLAFEQATAHEPLHAVGWLVRLPGYWMIAGVLGLVVLVATVIWSWRVGVNDFSLHALYGNRLVRAYLGASNLRRRAHPFTGFDQQDNSVRMGDLAAHAGRRRGPYPIINAAINLVSSRRLAWQKRKAASFTFTPLFCGYEFCEENNTGNGPHTGRAGGYVESNAYGGGGGRGVSLGKAMTISGAAASPNMGYHSSPAITFLMTTFNVRLGWWLPNTAKRNTSLLKVRGPRAGLLYLLAEALGQTGTEDDYVYLSDGGHFENLGIYELVRRRCHLIIASDAEADPHLTFSGLGNAIEKCRTDLGVPIRIDVSQIKRAAATGRSPWHCVVGCIRYSEADPDQHDGTLLYLKATLTGDEPQDVATYANANPSFPHETTADQWFDETQFESYRALGEHSALKALRNAVAVARHGRTPGEHQLERIFLELRKQWYPRAMQGGASPADHEARLERLLDTLRTASKLEFLDSQLYPNLQLVADRYFGSGAAGQDANAQEANKPRAPRDAAEFRAGFYFCNELIELMQRIFHDKQLDTEYGAPSNRGWMNLFRRWALSSMFRFTWAMTAGTYSARFQSFCEYQLALDSGEPAYGEPIKLIATVDDAGEDARQVDIRVATETGQGQESGKAKARRGKKHKAEHAGEGDQSLLWSPQVIAGGLHLYERWLVREFITAYVHADQVETVRPRVEFEVYPLKLKVDNVRNPEKGADLTLNAGLVIVGPHPQHPHRGRAVLHLRIRRGMRNMDLARKAFLAIRERMDAAVTICPIEELPDVQPAKFETSLQKRAYYEIHLVERENLQRCHWFSQLLEETAHGGVPGTRRPGR